MNVPKVEFDNSEESGIARSDPHNASVFSCTRPLTSGNISRPASGSNALKDFFEDGASLPTANAKASSFSTQSESNENANAPANGAEGNRDRGRGDKSGDGDMRKVNSGCPPHSVATELCVARRSLAHDPESLDSRSTTRPASEGARTTSLFRSRDMVETEAEPRITGDANCALSNPGSGDICSTHPSIASKRDHEACSQSPTTDSIHDPSVSTGDGPGCTSGVALKRECQSEDDRKTCTGLEVRVVRDVSKVEILMEGARGDDPKRPAAIIAPDDLLAQHGFPLTSAVTNQHRRAGYAARPPSMRQSAAQSLCARGARVQAAQSRPKSEASCYAMADSETSTETGNTSRGCDLSAHAADPPQGRSNEDGHGAATFRGDGKNLMNTGPSSSCTSVRFQAKPVIAIPDVATASDHNLSSEFAARRSVGNQITSAKPSATSAEGIQVTGPEFGQEADCQGNGSRGDTVDVALAALSYANAADGVSGHDPERCLNPRVASEHRDSHSEVSMNGPDNSAATASESASLQTLTAASVGRGRATGGASSLYLTAHISGPPYGDHASAADSIDMDTRKDVQVHCSSSISALSQTACPRSTSSAGKKRKRSRATDSRDDMMNAMCMICLEKLSDPTEGGGQKMLGLLDSCSHRYCYTCILEWSKVTNKCPQCKNRFHSIRAVKELRRNNSRYRGKAVSVEDREQTFSFADVRDVVVLDPDVGCHSNCLLLGAVDAFEQQGWEFSVQCEQCSGWYHGLCVGFRVENAIPEDWTCRLCSGLTYEPTPNSGAGVQSSSRAPSTSASRRARAGDPNREIIRRRGRSPTLQDGSAEPSIGPNGRPRHTQGMPTGPTRPASRSGRPLRTASPGRAESAAASSDIVATPTASMEGTTVESPARSQSMPYADSSSHEGSLHAAAQSGSNGSACPAQGSTPPASTQALSTPRRRGRPRSSTNSSQSTALATLPGLTVGTSTARVRGRPRSNTSSPTSAQAEPTEVRAPSPLPARGSGRPRSRTAPSASTSPESMDALSVVLVPPRSRGRPPSSPVLSTSLSTEASDVSRKPSPPARGRGRPRSRGAAATPSSGPGGAERLVSTSARSRGRPRSTDRSKSSSCESDKSLAAPARARGRGRPRAYGSTLSADSLPPPPTRPAPASSQPVTGASAPDEHAGTMNRSPSASNAADQGASSPVPGTPAPSFLQSLEGCQETELCDVCGFDTESENLIVYCGSCGMGVHQTCYGISEIPKKEWYCSPCAAGRHPSSVACRFCPVKGGALKRCTDGSWGHILCAFWIPECCFLDPEKMEPIGSINKRGQAGEVDEFLPSFRSRKCYICGTMKGCVIRCHATACKFHLHPSCGNKAGNVYMEIETSMKTGADAKEYETVNLVARCPRHQKAKSSRDRRVRTAAADSDPLRITGKFVEIVDATNDPTIFKGKVTWFDPEQSRYCVVEHGEAALGGDCEAHGAYWITSEKLVEAKAVCISARTGERLVVENCRSEEEKSDLTEMDSGCTREEGSKDATSAASDQTDADEKKQPSERAQDPIREAELNKDTQELVRTEAVIDTSKETEPCDESTLLKSGETRLLFPSQSSPGHRPDSGESGHRSASDGSREATSSESSAEKRSGATAACEQNQKEGRSFQASRQNETLPCARPKGNLLCRSEGPSTESHDNLPCQDLPPMKKVRVLPGQPINDGLTSAFTAASSATSYAACASRALERSDAAPLHSSLDDGSPPSRQGSAQGDTTRGDRYDDTRIRAAELTESTGMFDESSTTHIRPGSTVCMDFSGLASIMRVQVLCTAGGPGVTYFAGAYADATRTTFARRALPRVGFGFEDVEESERSKDATGDGGRESPQKKSPMSGCREYKVMDCDGESVGLDAPLARKSAHEDEKESRIGERTAQDDADDSEIKPTPSSRDEDSEMEDGQIEILSDGRADIMPPSPIVDMMPPSPSDGDARSDEEETVEDATGPKDYSSVSQTPDSDIVQVVNDILERVVERLCDGQETSAASEDMEISSDDLSLEDPDGLGHISPSAIGAGDTEVGDDVPICVASDEDFDNRLRTQPSRNPDKQEAMASASVQSCTALSVELDIGKADELLPTSSVEVLVNDGARVKSGMAGVQVTGWATTDQLGEQNQYESLRGIVRHQLEAILRSASKGKEEALAGGNAVDVLKRIANDVEEELFRRQFREASGGREYKAKYKQLLLSLGNVRNYRLVASVLAGSTTPADLATKDAVGLLNSLSSSLNCLAIPLAGRPTQSSPRGLSSRGRPSRRGRMQLL